jgi:anti-anti-sigma factor
MELHITEEGQYVVATTSGLLDDSAGALFRQSLYPRVEEHGTRLVLDLSKSDRITSAGLGYLVQLVANANTNGGRVILAGCTPFVSTVLSHTKLDSFFETAESVSEAAGLVVG